MTVQYSVGKTNCLTEVPNNVKLRLDDGILTLEKGSKVYIPNGFESDGVTPKFDEKIIESDLTQGTFGSASLPTFIAYRTETESLQSGTVTDAVSGTTPPTSGFFYNLSTNKILFYESNVVVSEKCSFPLAIYTRTSGVPTSINQTFDWCGYIGRSWFILNNTKGLQANGLNVDGTYKSITRTASSVLVHDINPAWGNIGDMKGLWWGNNTLESQAAGRFSTNKTVTGQYVYTYVESENYWYYTNDSGTSWVGPNSNIVVADMNFDGTRITSFTPYEVKTTNNLKNMQIKYGVGNTNCLTEIPQDINLELDPLNVTVVGTPTFNNGVVSGFSTSNYLTLPEIFQPVDNNWELLIKYTPTATPSDWASLIGCGDSLDWTSGVHIYHYSDGKLGLECTSTNGSWDIVRQQGQTVLTLGTTYWVKAIYNKINYSLYLSTNGIDWNQEVSVDSTTPIHASVIQTLGINVGYSKTIIGSIDLSESYIKINDEIWWKGGTGSLTLKKGSKVYVPNGKNDDDSNKFDIKVVENDVKLSTYSMASSTKLFVYMNARGTSFGWRPIANAYSGTSDTGGLGTNFYDITNNIITAHNTAGDVQVSFPFAIITTNSSGIITSIDQIFDWCGYIGSTVFALPGVKGLIPNGWNEDGTYKSIEFETDKVLTYTYTDTSNHDIYLTLSKSTLNIPARVDFVYDKNINFNLYKGSTKTKDMACGNAVLSSGKITSFTPYETKNTNDTIDIKEVHQCVGKTNCLTEIPNDINLELDPLNVTVVGTPTNSNGVVSGFSTSNYIKTNEIPPFDKALSFEIVIKFTINSLSGLQGFAGMLTGDNVQCNYYISSANKLCSDGIYGNLEGLTTLSIGQTYWSKLSYDGSKYDLLLSTNGIDYNLESSVTTNSKITTVSNFAFGVDRNANTGNNHSIDIKESYIKINDEFVWKGGTGHAILKSGSKVYIPNGFEEENYYKHNVTKIGSPTLTNGIANNFSVGNLLTLNNSFNVEDKNWEVRVKITTGSSISGGQTIWGSVPDYNGFLLRANNGTVTLWLSTNGTSWNGLSSVASTLVLQPNTTYYIKLSFNGTQYLIDASNDGVNYNNYLTHSSTVLMIENHSTIGGHGVTTSSYDTPFLGSIDLTQSYIKINDEIVWQGIIEGTKTDNDYVVYSGNKKFDEVVIENDLIVSIADNNEYFIFYNMNDNNLWFSADEYTRSGSSNPSDLWGFFYNSTDNKVYYLRNGTTPDELTFSIPVAIVVSNVSSGITSVNQIFNGIGYIGSRYFMTNGVKCLEPDGWNEDGTYKVNERQSSNVYVSSEQTGDVTNRAICLTYNSNNELISDYMTNYYETQSRSDVSTGGWYFIKDENQIENFNGTTWQGKVYRTKVGSYQVISGKITNFNVDNIKTTNDTKIIYKSDEINFSPEIDSWQ